MGSLAERVTLFDLAIISANKSRVLLSCCRGRYLHHGNSVHQLSICITLQLEHHLHTNYADMQILVAVCIRLPC